ncbi:hypothetical protein [Listeria aquatica]|uniref:Uncharacterized protein n=1 Tax=Listeria aquatica FSL S10-1188 TaxID=1265818 RepID=W7AMY0_9LIST|nr:hypothetical protein [Listeria aquatica]EUJ16604.1 hypothetical protein MAQA_15746 [Listeria aquatica FSL S10-1188]
MKKPILKTSGAVLIGVATISQLISVNNVLAEPIKNLPKVEVPTDTSVASSKYSVIAKFNKEKNKKFKRLGMDGLLRMKIMVGSFSLIQLLIQQMRKKGKSVLCIPTLVLTTVVPLT